MRLLNLATNMQRSLFLLLLLLLPWVLVPVPVPVLLFLPMLYLVLHLQVANPLLRRVQSTQPIRKTDLQGLANDPTLHKLVRLVQDQDSRRSHSQSLTADVIRSRPRQRRKPVVRNRKKSKRKPNDYRKSTAKKKNKHAVNSDHSLIHSGRTNNDPYNDQSNNHTLTHTILILSHKAQLLTDPLSVPHNNHHDQISLPEGQQPQQHQRRISCLDQDRTAMALLRGMHLAIIGTRPCSFCHNSRLDQSHREAVMASCSPKRVVSLGL